MITNCSHCKAKIEKLAWMVKKSKAEGNPLYCDRKCAGKAKRTSKEEKVRLKAEYDKRYREANEEYIKERNQKYNETPAGRAMQKRNREKMKESHLAYCRTPKYKKWKHEYDQLHVAKKKYGELWESHLAIKKIQKEIDAREVRQINNLHNKTQKRRTQWQQQKRTKSSLQTI